MRLRVCVCVLFLGGWWCVVGALADGVGLYLDIGPPIPSHLICLDTSSSPSPPAGGLLVCWFVWDFGKDASLTPGLLTGMFRARPTQRLPH